MTSAVESATDNTHLDAFQVDSNNSYMDSANERAYGTFEVSVIEVDSDSEQQPLQVAHSADFDANEDEANHTCTGDCCALVSFLWLPFRAKTYKVIVFHLFNFLFAICAAIWTILFYTLKIAVCSFVPWPTSLRSLEAVSLRKLLRVDATLFNFICPSSERVMVDSSSTSSHEDNGALDFQAQIYFGVGKLLCSALPGVVSAWMFLMAIHNLVCIVAFGAEAEPTAPIEHDVLVLLTILALYIAASLTKVFAAISRHITIYFCAQHLLYASTM